ncbi:MAG: hypothetical protein HC875_39420 [Anaerolineales bacterium]|nr:hypothetical protein [Anaerolineales bacterium]
MAGYKIQPSTFHPSNLQPSNLPTLTLYWHALAPLPVNYTVSVRARTAAGERLAQQDQWPVNNLLPTTLWRQGDYVTDEHTLEISPADHSHLDNFEIVVYQPKPAKLSAHPSPCPSPTMNKQQPSPQNLISPHPLIHNSQFTIHNSQFSSSFSSPPSCASINCPPCPPASTSMKPAAV